MDVPFNNLKAQYLSIKPEIDEAINKILSEGNFIGGIYVGSFEKNFKDMHGLKNCVSVGNGTDALFAIIKNAGIGQGDEVITPAWSWFSTAEIITASGATPVFADVDEQSFLISPSDVEKKITKKTKAVIAVHLYGQCCDMKTLMGICMPRKILIIEDCAQAHGARQENRISGTFGFAAAFSFYPTKNLGAFGDGGCILTDDDQFALRVRKFVNHGGLTKNEHEFVGVNSRMDTLQAAILNVKIKHLESWNQRRREHAFLYARLLSSLESVKLPQTNDDNEHTYHLFVIRARRRDELKEFLDRNNIQTQIHYPTPIPFEPAYKSLGYRKNNFPVSSKLQDEVLSLPVFPELAEDQITYVCEKIRAFYS